MKILLLTSRFPYMPGEAFLEAELDELGRDPSLVACVLPYKGSGTPRPTPPGVRVDSRLVSTTGLRHRTLFYICAPFRASTLKELVTQARIGRMSIRLIARTFMVAGHTARVEHAINQVLSEDPGIQIVYSYWHGPTAYAAARIRRRRSSLRVITRAHRGDVFEESSPSEYKPFHRESLQGIDMLYAISHDVMQYVRERYGAKNVQVARLGVQPGPERARKLGGPVDTCRLVSISQCIPVKRLHLVIRGLAYAARTMPDIQFEWTHFGGGPNLDILHDEAEAILGQMAGVRYSFRGETPHDEILSALANEDYSMLLNTSAVEGISVAAMEAMGHHVPVVATDVGAMSELVNSKTGYLLPRDPAPQEVGEAIRSVFEDPERDKRGIAAYQMVLQEYSAASNYHEFYQSLRMLF